MIYVFGAILIYSGYKLARGVEEEVEPEKNPFVKFAQRVMPLTPKYSGSKFYIRDPAFKFTPMILVLLAIETTDVVFAFDSVPAVLAITTNFYIAYTSNIMAVLGLRTLYMLVSHVMYKLERLNVGLGVLLAFLGLKMILPRFGVEIPSTLSMVIVLSIIAITFTSAIIISKRNTVKEKETISTKRYQSE